MHFLLTKRACEVAGDTTYLLMLAEGLVERGHRVTMAAAPGGLSPRFRDIGADLMVLPPHPLLGPTLKLRYSKHWHFMKKQVDAIICTGRGPARWAAYDLANSLGVPCVCTLQDHSEPRQSPEEYDRPDAVVTVEQPIYTSAIKFGVPEEKISLWPRPVRSAKFRPAPSGNFSMLWMGRMSGRKAWSAKTLLDAVPILFNKIPNLRITLVGEGSKRGQLVRMADKLCDKFGQESVQVQGFTTRPLKKIESANLVVGGGYTCLESLYNGRPAIAAGFGWQGVMTAEEIPRGYDLHFGDRTFEPTNSVVLAEAVMVVQESLASDGQQSPFLPDRSWFTIDHSLNGQAQRMEELVKELIAKKEPALAN